MLLTFSSLTFFSLSAIFRSMPQAASFAGLILAAGESSRMGRDKALLPWPPNAHAQGLASGTFLSAAIKSLILSTDFVLVVAGQNEAALAPVVYINAASMIINPDISRGQFSSLQVGQRVGTGSGMFGKTRPSIHCWARLDRAISARASHGKCPRRGASLPRAHSV